MRVVIRAVLLAVLLASVAKAQDAPPPKTDLNTGFELYPKIAWTSPGGDHRVGLYGFSRVRYEYWKARTPNQGVHIGGTHTRLGLTYDWKNYFSFVAEGQWTLVGGLNSDSSGLARVYWLNNDRDGIANSFKMSTMFGEARPFKDTAFRVGRTRINMGTFVKYKEPNWKYLKVKRTSQRLMGTVGWTFGERAYDSVSGMWQTDDYALHGWVAFPTTGVFEVDSAYSTNWGITTGGLDFTAKPDTWLPNTELSSFFIGYSDNRDTADVAGLFGKLTVYTIGAQALGVYPLGPGNLDVLAWGAFQFGTFAINTPTGVRNADQIAYAFLGEVGYQFTDIPLKPWFRTGVNAASGDDDPNSGTRNTFFNILPTNHLYYGYTDQFAFSNLINWFFQVRLFPFPKVALDFYVHKFWLANDNDSRYFGTGAFNKRQLGYGTSPSNGSNDGGTEIDFTASYAFNKNVSVAAGYAFMWGGDIFTSSNQNTNWGFIQMILKY